jgi:hypothetical protein
MNATDLVSALVRQRRVASREHLGHSIAMSVPIRCADGFEVSVQASGLHYCAPRNVEGPWESFELGFPSEVEPLLTTYAEEPHNPTGTVYPNVPAALVLEVLTKHGGVAA